MSGQDPYKYYRPYDSADESGADSDSETTDSWYSSSTEDQSQAPPIGPGGIPNFRAFASQMQLRDAAGPPISSIMDQFKYGADRLGRNTVYSGVDQKQETPDAADLARYGKTEFATADATEASIIMIDSRFRDRQAYPQPTLCTLRLPRPYKNITNIAMAEMKLLTSFYFFRNSKRNTDITIYEKDRFTYGLNNQLLGSTIISTVIAEGSYNINQLQTELQIKLNYTPLFFDFVGGFNQFFTLFRASGDLGLNFNEPGDYFFNNTTNTYVANPTKDTIILHFWRQRNFGFQTYTIQQTSVAYYYPVLNEAIQDEQLPSGFINLEPGLGIDPLITTIDELRERILLTFQGLNDPVIYALIQANLGNLDIYRLQQTFRFALINKYTIARDVQSQRVYITAPSLNTSLLNLLSIQRNKFVARALQLYNINARQYATLQSNADFSRAVLQGMYDFTQSNFLNSFAVPWDQYTLSYYGNLDNIFFLQNAEGVTGLATNSFEALEQNIQSISSSVLGDQTVNPVHYWPNLKNIPIGRNYFIFNLSSSTSSFNRVYDMTRAIVSPCNVIIQDPEDFIYNDFLTGSANVVCPIQAGKYTVFRFHSPVRQTLAIETLPRPLQYRLPKYNQSNYDSTINEYFDFNYEFKFSPTSPYPPAQSNQFTMAFDNLPTSNLIQIANWASTNAIQTHPLYSWERSFQSSFTQTSTIDLTVATPYRSLFYTFTTPRVKNASPNSNYTYSINLTTLTLTSNRSVTATPPFQDIRVFLYHDRGAFQADVLCNRSENPLFYKFSTVLTTAQPSTTISFTAYPEQQYYVSVRPDPINYGTTHVKTFPWFSPTIISTAQSLSVVGLNPATDPFTSNFDQVVQTNFNYAQVYDSNWIQLPIQSTLWLPDPSVTTSTLGLGLVPIGYDTEGVSTDYTDYIPFTPFDSNFSFNPAENLGIDPFNTYQFQSNSDYDSSITQSWFYPTSLNSIFLPALEDIYIASNVPERQFKIAHYYSLNYLPEPEINFPLPSTLIASNDTNQKPYALETTQGEPIQGYSYSSNESSTIQLGRGVLGFSFIPGEGVWDIQKTIFRTAITDSNNDPNRLIKYLGVFNLGDIIYKNTVSINISSAILLLSSINRVTYSNSDDPNQAGFDVKGGTYYQFGKDLNFKPSGTSTILGYSQPARVLSDQPESMYTFIAFSEFGFPTTIKALSGSAIPYPLYNTAYTSSVYVDGSRPFNSNYGLVFPSSFTQTDWPFAEGEQYGPPGWGDITQSVFQLSIPIGTTVLPFKQPFIINNDSNFLQPWQTPMTPSKVFGTMPNYVMFQDTNFTVYAYNPLQNNRTFNTPYANLTGDEVFPGYENTALVATTGNSTGFYFLGFSNLNSTTNRLRLKKYSPFTGAITEFPLDSSYAIPWHTTVKSFTVNDLDQLVLTAKNVDANTTSIYYSLEPSTNMTSYLIPNNSNAIHTMDPIASTLYYMPLNQSNVGRILYQTTLDTPFDVGQPWLLSTTNGFSNWTQIAVNDKESLPAADDRIFAMSASNQYQSNIFYSASWNPDNYSIVMELVSTPITQSNGQGARVGDINTGFGGSIWITSAGQPIVWVNRNTEPDQDGILDAAWQIFYPFQKIILTKLANTYNPITDLTSINYPEYPHTQMFYYRTGPQFSNDTFRKWGLECNINYTAANTNFAGFYFNSYIQNVPLLPSSNANFQYIAIRGFSPTENSETLLRFSLTNQYNFGYITQRNLIDEINLYTSSPQLFNPTYANTLNLFNNSYFQSTSFFGQGLVPDFDGSNYDSSNFAQFASNYSTIYSGYSNVSFFLSQINSYINSNINIYVSTNLQYIFPTTFQQRQSFSDPVSFSILWLSSLLPNYRPLLEDWGLGYNLGFAKVDTRYSTYHRAESFYKILEDYIYLRLNPEFPMNRLDSTAKEDFKITRESTGQIQFYFGKLLLNDFNSYSRSFINNQLVFNPPIPKLENMYFEWVDIAGNTIDNDNCEWSCSLTISESKTRATATSGQPKLPPPEKK